MAEPTLTLHVTRRPKRGSDKEYERFIRRMDAKMLVAIRKLARTRNIDDFEQRFQKILEELFHGAVWRGRIRGSGNGSPMGTRDRVIADEYYFEQLEFFAEFVADIRSGLYETADDRISIPAIRNRARYYLERARGAANEAFTYESPEGEEFDWVLGIGEHCDDCLTWAAGSPYRSYELTTQPGLCETICRSKCHCTIRRRNDGKHGFAYVDPYERYNPRAKKPKLKVVAS